MKTIKNLLSFSLLFSILVLTGCGGGGGGSNDGSTSTTSSGGNGTSTSPTILVFNNSISYQTVMRAYQGVSYYKVVGLIPGEDYRVTISSDAGLGFNGYRNSDFLSGFECGPTTTGSTCTANSNGDLYLMAWSVSGPVADASYTISVVSTISEGSPSAPKDLTNSLPYSATLTAPKTKSFFSISGLTPGNSYTVAFQDGAATNLDLRVYQDNFQAVACTDISYDSAKSCTLTAAGSQMWFTVEGTGDFTVSVTDNGLPAITYANEGTTISPTLLTYSTDGLVSSGEVGLTNSYYNLSGLKADTGYLIVLKNMLDDVDLFAYSDSSFATSTCPAVKTTESCLETANISGDIWFSVSGDKAYQYLGASYDIYVYEYFPDEGTSSSRVILNYSEPLIYNGTANNYSYYQVTGMLANTTYLIDVSNFTGAVEVYAVGVDWSAYSSCNGREEVYGSGILRCLVTSGDTGIIDLRVREGTYLTGTAFTAEINVSPYQSEGSQASPVVLTTALSQAGAIGGVSSYYRIDGLTADTAYTVTVSGMNSSYDFFIYQDGANPNLWSKVSGNYDCTGDMNRTSCTRRTIGTSMWLMVGEYAPLNGAALTIDVVESAYQAEGILATPIPLTFGSVDLPHSGATDSSQSYYAINGLTAGTEYVISLSNVSTADYVRFYVYDDNALLGSTTYGESVCNVSAYDSNTPFCRLTPTGTSVWVMIDGVDTGQGAFYDLNAVLSPVAESLTIDTSVAGTFPRASSTNQVSSSYTLTNLLPKQLYNVSISGLTADIDLTVAKNSFSSTACDSQLGYADEQCLKGTNAAGELRVRVLGDKSSYGSFFTLNITPGPINEGELLSPIVVPHDTVSGSTVRSSQVGHLSSYYKITGLTPDRLYEVKLTGSTGDARLSITNDANYDIFSNPQCISNINLRCGGIADTSGVLYVLVLGPSTGAHFSLEVLDGLLPDGSITAGQPIVYSGALTSYNGKVDFTNSYYEISNLDPNTSYTVTLTGLSEWVPLFVYEDAGYSTIGCSSQSSLIPEPSCITTTPKGGGAGTASLYVRIPGALTVAGATYTLQIQ